MSSEIKILNQHTRQTFVRNNVIEIEVTKLLLNVLYPFYPKTCQCISGYLDNGNQFWKVNYHWDNLMFHIDKFCSQTKADAKYVAAAKSIAATLSTNSPNPVSGYRNDKNPGDTVDKSSYDKITLRHAIMKKAKVDFEKVMIESGFLKAETKSNPPKSEKGFWLSVAPVAKPGTSKHNTGYALDIAGNNLETTRISKLLGATLVFNEASHVHVEFANWMPVVLKLAPMINSQQSTQGA
jgi:hypothetical protein